MLRPKTSIRPAPLSHGPHDTVAGFRDLITKRIYNFGYLQQRAGAAHALTIGRDPSCDIVLADTGISAVHCTVELLHDGAYRLRDKGSRNGTFLMMPGVVKRIRTVQLTMGTWIWLGSTTLVPINEYEKTLLSATSHTEFERQAYRVYGTLCSAGKAIGRSPETIRRAFQKAQERNSRRPRAIIDDNDPGT